MTGEHAMNYLTKYIAKQDVEAPSWVLDYAGNFRKFSTSRGLCGEIKSRPEGKRRTRVRRTVAERIESCRQSSRVLDVLKTRIGCDEDATIKKRYRFRKTLDVKFDALTSTEAGGRAIHEALKLGLPIECKSDVQDNDGVT